MMMDLKSNIYVGDGILGQIKEPPAYKFTVEDLYKNTREDYWPMIDYMLSDRKDLQERIQKIKYKIIIDEQNRRRTP